jgi:adenylate kinase
VVHREDDTPQAVRKRLDLYSKETEPLIAYYEQLRMLAAVDGIGSADEVTQRIIHVIEARSRGGIVG